MNLLTILGCIGGILYLINYICSAIVEIIKVIRKYKIYKNAYEERDDSEYKPAKKIGFESNKEEKKDEETPEVLKYKELYKTIKIDDSGYFDMYWESNPVDDEFIEDEDYEDWEDKYPDLHIER